MPEPKNLNPQMLPKAVVIISRVTACSVALLTLLSFLLSYEALHNLASETGAFPSKAAWIYPLILDGAIIVFSLSALRASICGEPTKWFMNLVIVVTLTSILLNVAHAPSELLPRIIAGTAPALLFLAFESLMRQVKAEVVRAHGKWLPASFPNTKVRPTVISEEERVVRRVKVRELLEQGHSQSAISKQLGVSAATVRRDRNSLRLVA